jgi:hypothetical protein
VALLPVGDLACSLTTDLSGLSIQFTGDAAAPRSDSGREDRGVAALDAGLAVNDAGGRLAAPGSDSGAGAPMDAEIAIDLPDALGTDAQAGPASDGVDAASGGLADATATANADADADGSSTTPVSPDAAIQPGGPPDAGRDAPVPVQPDAGAGVGGVDSGASKPDATTTDAAAAPPMCPLPPAASATLGLAASSPDVTACGDQRAQLPASFIAVDPQTFDGSNACGGCIRIESASAVLEAPVLDLGVSLGAVDQPTLLVNQADLSRLVPDGSPIAMSGISWRYVPCSDAPAAMTFTLQVGSNPSYAAVLVQHQRNRISLLEYKRGDAYVKLVRTSYDYWVSPSGMGPGPFTLRATDVLSQSVEQAGIPLAPGVPFEGSVQFPPCPQPGATSAAALPP